MPHRPQRLQAFSASQTQYAAGQHTGHDAPLSPEELDDVEKRLEASMIVASPRIGQGDKSKQHPLSQAAIEPVKAGQEQAAFAPTAQSTPKSGTFDILDPTYAIVGDRRG